MTDPASVAGGMHPTLASGLVFLAYLLLFALAAAIAGRLTAEGRAFNEAQRRRRIEARTRDIEGASS